MSRGHPHPIVVLIATAACVMAAVLFVPADVADLGTYLAMGRDMGRYGGIAGTDIWTIHGGDFINATWLAQRALFLVVGTAGYGALPWLPALSLAATILIVGLSVWRICGRPGTALLAGPVVAVLISQNAAIRPELFALPLFAVYMAIAFLRRPTWLTITASAAIVALWSNLHGSFPVAIAASALIGAGAGWAAFDANESSLGDRVRAGLRAMVSIDRGGLHLLTACVVGIASLVNPWGPRVYEYIVLNLSASNYFGGTEWAPTSLFSLAGVRLVAALSVLWLQALASQRRVRAQDVPILVGFVVLAVVSMRYVVWLGMILPFAMGYLVPRREPEDVSVLTPVSLAVAALVLIAAVGVAAPQHRLRDGRFRVDSDTEVTRLFGRRHTHVQAIRAVGEEIGCCSPPTARRGFATLGWSGWLEASFNPKQLKTFVDIRLWVFDREVLAHYHQLRGARPGWERLLEKYQLDLALLERDQAEPLIDALADDPTWRRVYEDDAVAVFARLPVTPGGPATGPGVSPTPALPDPPGGRGP